MLSFLKREVNTNPFDTNNGGRLWNENNCISCHGQKGEKEINGKALNSLSKKTLYNKLGAESFKKKYSFKNTEEHKIITKWNKIQKQNIANYIGKKDKNYIEKREL